MHLWIFLWINIQWINIHFNAIIETYHAWWSYLLAHQRLELWLKRNVSTYRCWLIGKAKLHLALDGLFLSEQSWKRGIDDINGRMLPLIILCWRSWSSPYNWLFNLALLCGAGNSSKHNQIIEGAFIVKLILHAIVDDRHKLHLSPWMMLQHSSEGKYQSSFMLQVLLLLPHLPRFQEVAVWAYPLVLVTSYKSWLIGQGIHQDLNMRYVYKISILLL